MQYWLLKSEPQVYSITDLKQDNQTIWDGVRNYQARNFLRAMKVNDLAFFYHSNTKPPGIVGLIKIVDKEIIDPTQFMTESPYYDPKSTPDSPRWQTVKVEFIQEFSEMVTLDMLKEKFSPEDLFVVKRGNRLSVMPVKENIAHQILEIVNINGKDFDGLA